MGEQAKSSFFEKCTKIWKENSSTSFGNTEWKQLFCQIKWKIFFKLYGLLKCLNFTIIINNFVKSKDNPIWRMQTKPEQKFTKTYGLEVVVETMHCGLSRPSGVLHILSRSLANFLEQIKLCTGQYTKLYFGRISNKAQCAEIDFMWTFGKNKL